MVRRGPVVFLALLLGALIHHGGKRLDAAGEHRGGGKQK